MNKESLLELHEKILYPIVRVRTSTAGGSGTVIYSEKDDEGECHTYILTNHHVVSDAIKIDKKWNSLLKREIKVDVKKDVSVEFFNFEYDSWEDGQSATKASIIDYDQDRDIALLKLKSARKVEYIAKLFPKGEEKKRLRMFMDTYAVGCSLGHPPLATTGILAGFNDIIDNYPYWLQTAPTIYGSSGGAVFLAETKEFIGIPSRIAVTGVFGSNAITHLSFFIPITTIYKFLDDNLMYFIYDPEYSYSECEKLREDKRKQDEFGRLVNEEKGKEE